MLLDPTFPVPPPEGPPRLMVVIDTEEEFDWHKPFDRRQRAVTNIAAQRLAQSIFNAAGLRPTYVIDHPVATTPEAAAVLRGFVEAGQALVGAHLHPWVNPPDEEEVNAFNSYAGNLPPALERAKLAVLRTEIARSIGIAPRIFKAGRYGLGPQTGASLRGLGFDIDLSALPFTDLGEDGGPDYRAMPDRPFWSGAPGQMFCVPMSRGYCGLVASDRVYRLGETPLGRRLRLTGLMARAGITERATLTPEGVDLAAQKRLVRAMLAQGHRVFTLSYHSPSLAPGHTPYVRSLADLERFIDDIRRMLDFILGDLNARPTTPIELRDLALARI